jgi:hypothetical protein
VVFVILYLCIDHGIALPWLEAELQASVQVEEGDGLQHYELPCRPAAPLRSFNQQNGIYHIVVRGVFGRVRAVFCEQQCDQQRVGEDSMTESIQAQHIRINITLSISVRTGGFRSSAVVFVTYFKRG